MWQLTASMSLDATSRNTQFVHDAHISFIAKSYADSRNLEREKPAPLRRSSFQAGWRWPDLCLDRKVHRVPRRNSVTWRRWRAARTSHHSGFPIRDCQGSVEMHHHSELGNRVPLRFSPQSDLHIIYSATLCARRAPEAVTMPRWQDGHARAFASLRSHSPRDGRVGWDTGGCCSALMLVFGVDVVVVEPDSVDF